MRLKFGFGVPPPACMPAHLQELHRGPVCFAEFLQLVKLGTFIHFVATILATVLLKYLNCSDERCHGCRVMEFILIWAVTCVFFTIIPFLCHICTSVVSLAHYSLTTLPQSHF